AKITKHCVRIRLKNGGPGLTYTLALPLIPRKSRMVKVDNDLQRVLLRINRFSGGELNTCYNCLDVHSANGYGNHTAVIFDSPVTQSRSTLTYDDLLRKVSLFSGVLSRKFNVRKGDTVVIYMPMVVECMVAMLACSRIGAVHAVVFGGFSAEQLASRIKSAQPKVIVTASFGKERQKLVSYKPTVDNAIKAAGYVAGDFPCILYNRPEFEKVELDAKKSWFDWDELMSSTQPHDAVPVEANHPLYILYTSGTTGIPKGIVRPNGGHAVALKYTLANVFGMNPGDRWWASSEFGWVVGHSFCCYGPLLHRTTSVIYEGKPVHTPDAAQVFRVLHEYGVNGWYTTPSALRSIRQEDPFLSQSKKYREQLDKLRYGFVVGEHCDAETLTWLANGLPKHVRLSDSWWQTETAWPMTSSCFGLKGGYLPQNGVTTPMGSAGRPVPGFNIKIGSTIERKETDHDEIGYVDQELDRILVKLPLPPGAASTFWNDHERFMNFYFSAYPGYYDTMDVGTIDKDGFVYILSRADDVINVAGHRLSTSAIEEACYRDENVIDCAVIPVPHQIKGYVPFGLLVTKKECKKTAEQVIRDSIASVRENVGPVASFSQACVVPALPKTRSGKIARPSLANMASGKPIKVSILFAKPGPFLVPPTIEDPGVYHAIYDALKQSGLNPTKPE
ncbi:AMP-binding enzyme, partial [Opisthorchis viverrini]